MMDYYEYETIIKLDGGKLPLFGTDYTVNAASVHQDTDGDNMVLYSATNESGTTSYGEIGKEEITSEV